MKKLIFSLAGVALVAGSALAFTTAKVDDPVDCSQLDPGHNCTDPTTPDDPEACCVSLGQYFRPEIEN